MNDSRKWYKRFILFFIGMSIGGMSICAYDGDFGLEFITWAILLFAGIGWRRQVKINEELEREMIYWRNMWPTGFQQKDGFDDGFGEWEEATKKENEDENENENG